MPIFVNIYDGEFDKKSKNDPFFQIPQTLMDPFFAIFFFFFDFFGLLNFWTPFFGTNRTLAGPLLLKLRFLFREM